MTAHSFDPDPIARALVPAVRDLLLDEVRRHVACERQAQADAVDADIMRACRAVARASDKLAQARFSGSPEAYARRDLVKAAAALGTTLRKHGRMPKGE
ncbi:hypothetical protein MIC97_02305 [Aquamicrobium sp. NLF2-7]|uniref:hypothetical protein n=1 Tax=Aquamicrobium sp. NLF2-7 TaxID=2918753 RepID=UPI001EFAF813|nr:hypothetical protein [Aquamicrobium sp. NLF2-7]MCG8270337.1 hypothetical protein [Aquamicrobium sp. NLF2-7]